MVGRSKKHLVAFIARHLDMSKHGGSRMGDFLRRKKCKHEKKIKIVFGGFFCPSCNKNVEK